jgi:carboxymethylenebutenolidase
VIRAGLSLLVCALLAGCSSRTEPARPDEREPVSLETVKFASGDGKATGALARAKPSAPCRALVLVHGDYGLTEPVRAQASRLARRGYVCLAVDLYRGQKVEKLIDAHIMDRGLPEGRALADIRGAVSYLQSHPEVKAEKVGIIGWDMGGGLALDAALADNRIAAVVTCYGRLPTEAETLKTLKASVLGIYAEKDEGNPPETLAAFRKAMAKAGKRLAGLHVLAGCDQGFMLPAADARPGPRDAEATAEAWRLIDAYLDAEVR